MALTQDQVNWWFEQNPDATPEDVADAVKSIGGLAANGGLADMIANRYDISANQVTDYYNTYTAPKADTPVKQDTQTFTDTILSGGDTTQDDLLATLTDSTAGTTGADTTGTTTTTPTTYTKSFGGTDYSLANADVDFLVNQILNQNLTSQWKGEGFGSPQANARAMAENLLASGIKNINQVGLVDKKVDEAVTPVYEYVNTGGYDENGPIMEARIVGYKDSKGNPVDAKLVTQGTVYSGGDAGTAETAYTAPIGTTKIIGNKTTGTGLINDYGERGGVDNAFSGTYAGEGNTAYRVKFDDKGNPFFYTTGASSSDIADWGPILSLAAVIPSPLQPFAIAANAAIAIENNDVLGGIASLAGLAGFTEAAAGARILKAVQSEDPFAIVSSVMNSPFAGNIGGTMLTDTISLRDAGNAISIINNIENENWTAALTTAGQLTGSSDVQTAAAAARFIDAFEKNNFAGMYAAANGFTNAMNASNKITDKNVALNITNTLADANSAATEGTQLASLGSDTVSDAGNGFTVQGDGGSTLNFPDLTGSDSINADAALFNSSVGDLDATGNITDTTGLDTGDVIPGGDNVEELVVTGTGDKGTDTTTDTTDTTTKVNDKGTVVVTGGRETCPVGTTLNPETGDCDPNWDEGGGEVCGAGQVLDSATGMCIDEKDAVVITGKRDTCPVGTKLNPETGDCDPDWDEGGGEVCGVGEHQDPETGMCVPDEVETVKCEAGFHLGPDGKTCVADKEDDTPCADGFHRDEATGLCVPDDDEECKDGYEKVDGVCVPVCKEGYIRNLETGTCEKVEKECPPGYTRKDGKCVKDTVITPPVTCQPGYEKVDGVCVPMCQPGYQRVNGVCKKITTETVTTTPLNAQGERTDPIYAGAMDDFDLFATLEELLKENPDKKDTKKDTKKSKDKTKMATGGHLDDLLAEQMTVDDLLKLLR